MAEIIIKKSNNDREFQLSCLWDEEKLYFCKNAQTTLTCSVEMLTRSVAISSHLNEVNLNNFVSKTHPMSNQLKACSCARSWTSGSSLVFPTLTLASSSMIFLQVDESIETGTFFQIQLSISHFHLQALSFCFRNFHRKSTRFHEP